MTLRASLLALCLVAATPAAAQVEVAPLAPLDLFSAGARDTGLPADLWKGSSGDLARSVIPPLGRKPLSPATTAFARRVLATGAAAPEGVGQDIDLASARAQSLLMLGDAAGVNAMLQRVPNLQSSPQLSEAAAEAALMVGDDDRACRIAEALSSARDGIYWLRLRAFCQARAGQADAAQLTYSLANTAQRDPVYARLMGAVLGVAEPGPASLRNGLDHALSRKLGLDLAPALPMAHAAIAARYDKPGLAGGMGAPEPAADAAALASRLTTRGVGAFTLASRANAPLIAALARSGQPLENPALFARAAVAAGDLETARLIRGGMVQDQVPGASITDLAMLDGLLAAAEGRLDGPTLDRLVERGGALGPKSGAQPAALLLVALGTPMGPRTRAEFAAFDLSRGVASPARLAALDYAARAGLKGETALLAIAVAAGGGADGPFPADRAEIVRALARAGLAQEARAFAVEGLLALQVR